RGVALIIQQAHWRRREAAAVFGERNAEPLAIGGGLLVSKRQATERLRQSRAGRALILAADASNQVVGADLPGPQLDFDRLGYAAPGMGVGGDKDTRRPTGR